MRRLLLIVLYALGGAGSAHQSSPLIDVNFTQRSFDSYLFHCTPQISEEKVTQVHWKEKHINGTYSVIAVLNPYWGNYTKFPYQEVVKLHKKDGKTYMIEIITQEMNLCCEVVTFPSGSIHENCITIKGDSDVDNYRNAFLATLLVGGFFLLGSIVLTCHICWMRRKTSRRAFNIRAAREQLLTRNQRSQVPYRRASASVNLAYEPPQDTDLHSNIPRPTGAHLQYLHPTIHLPSEGLLPRNPTMDSHWPNEDTCSTPPSAPPLRNHVIHKALPAPPSIYSNILHRNKRHLKGRNVKNVQTEPDVNHHPQEMFSYEGTDPSSIPHYHAKEQPWLFEGAAHSSEDVMSSHSSRLSVPRTPESPFTTINPMYHTGGAWASHPKNSHLNYEHSVIS